MNKKLVEKIVFLAIFVLVFLYSYYLFNPMEHWEKIFHPAINLLFDFKNPYTIEKFFNPPWALLPLIPFYFLPLRLGSALLGATSIVSFGIVARKFGANWIVTLLFLLLPNVLYNSIQVNVDWLVVLGVLMPPQIGLFFVMAKPQFGLFIAIFWAVESWRKGGLSEVFKTYAPILITFCLSFIIFGFWILKSQQMFLQTGKNFWPWSIIIGIMFLILSFSKRKINFSLLSGPFISPYMQPYSWPIALLGLLPNNILMFLGILIVFAFGDFGKYWMLEITYLPVIKEIFQYLKFL